MTSSEKPSAKHDSIHESIADANAIEASLPTQDVGRILTRIDWRLLPALGLIYGISLMDRTSTANAAIAGMLVDLKIETGLGYNIITLSYFLSNILAQPVMAILCRKIGPRPFLSGVCIAWGVVVIGLGFTKEWVVQIPLRLLLGLFEAGFGPSAVYLLSTWYTRCMSLCLVFWLAYIVFAKNVVDEVGRRFSIFYLSGVILAALSGVLAYGLMQLDGREGIAGWRWSVL